MMTGFIGWHVMQEDMYYWWTCGSGGHVFLENMYYGRTCLVGEHVFQVCAEAAAIYVAVSVGNWCVVCLFFSSNILFALRHALQGIYCCKCSSWLCRLIFVVCFVDLFIDKSIIFMHA